MCKSKSTKDVNYGGKYKGKQIKVRVGSRGGIYGFVVDNKKFSTYEKAKKHVDELH